MRYLLAGILVLSSCDSFNAEKKVEESVEAPVPEPTAFTKNELNMQTHSASWEPTDAAQELALNSVYNLTVETVELEPSTLIFWDLKSYGANCDLQVFESEGFHSQAQLLCTHWGRLEIRVSALFADGRELVSELPLQAVETDPSGGGRDIPLRIYSIPLGVKGDEWPQNGWLQDGAYASAEVAYVGQTLRIINDDEELHHPVTTGGFPCTSSPVALNQGQSFDCKLTGEILEKRTYIIDQLNASEGGLRFKVLDADRIFNQQFTCTACHAPTYDADRGEIEAAIRGGVPQMSFLSTELDRVDGISSDEKLDAIMWYLNR